MGFVSATPIQKQAIPIILNHKDLIGCAQTGTGKTAAFLIPILEKLHNSNKKGIKVCVLVPTRELAQQIDENITALSYFLSVSAISIFGGNQPELFAQQKNALQEGVDVVMATPGRLIAHMNLGYVDFSTLDILILDEADRMLEMGFIADINKIIEEMPKKRQTLLFSATMKSEIRKLAQNILVNPEQINLSVSKPAAGVTQQAYLVNDFHKIKLLEYLIQHSQITNMLIFASRKSKVDEIYKSLSRLGVDCRAIHSDKEQIERNEILRNYKAQNFKILIATDILSRGIDIEELSHVVNFDVPDDPADYVHRVGRTARADKKGAAITFINDGKDQMMFYNIEQLIETQLPKLEIPTEIGESPKYEPEKFLRPKKKNFSNKNRKFKKPFHKKSRD